MVFICGIRYNSVIVHIRRKLIVLDKHDENNSNNCRYNKDRWRCGNCSVTQVGIAAPLTNTGYITCFAIVTETSCRTSISCSSFLKKKTYRLKILYILQRFLTDPTRSLRIIWRHLCNTIGFKRTVAIRTLVAGQTISKLIRC